uniref:Uncharacterized protein n=1 Tax=Setaria italica TaxID=4555 RepID=K3XNZ4_SETIT
MRLTCLKSDQNHRSHHEFFGSFISYPGGQLHLKPCPESEAVILNLSLDRNMPSLSRTAILLLLNLVLPFCSAL